MAIPKGTLLAILITTVSYILFVVVSGSVMLMNSNGEIEFVNNGTLELLTNCTLGPFNKCPYGLQNNFQVILKFYCKFLWLSLNKFGDLFSRIFISRLLVDFLSV